MKNYTHKFDNLDEMDQFFETTCKDSYKKK